MPPHLPTTHEPLSSPADSPRTARMRRDTLFVGLGLVLIAGCDGQAAGAGLAKATAQPPAPVEIAAIEHGPIVLRRVFSGTLEAVAEVQIAPRIPGHLERLAVDIGDHVERGQVIAWLDDDELQQSVAQAEADVAVAQANESESESSAELARRELRRLVQLHTDGVASEAALDSSRTAAVASDAAVTVAKARVMRARAALEMARLRLLQTRILADWDEPSVVRDDAPAEPEATRVIAERYVDVGSLVNASTPIVSIVSLDPIIAVVFIPERDYARVAVGQEATLNTDAYAGETFLGHVARIAPVFRRTTRQVRVELEIVNADERLKPGMFVRATLDLARDEDATIVPYAALTTRNDVRGVFVLPPDSDSVRWTPVTIGLREGTRVQISAPGLVGSVVTLGQELCDDGSRVTTPGAR